MNPTNASRAPRSALELGDTHHHEIVADEDVLSLAFQRDLEDIGSAIGVLAAIALVAMHVARGIRAVGGIRGAWQARAKKAVPNA